MKKSVGRSEKSVAVAGEIESGPGVTTGAGPETAPLPQEATATAARNARARRASRSARPGAKRITKFPCLWQCSRCAPGSGHHESYANESAERRGVHLAFVGIYIAVQRRLRYDDPVCPIPASPLPFPAVMGAATVTSRAARPFGSTRPAPQARRAPHSRLPDAGRTRLPLRLRCPSYGYDDSRLAAETGTLRPAP